MRADALAEALERDAGQGVRPWLVVASAGTVDTGAVDPLADIADLCERHGAWFHVDGAYGGLFMLCDEGRRMLAGIERADTAALDPHKTLFLPYGTGAVVARDGRNLLDAFSASADYIQPFGETDVGPSPGDLSPELTVISEPSAVVAAPARRSAAFRAAQSERSRSPLFPFAPRRWPAGKPAASGLSIVAFRYRPAQGDPDAFNRRLCSASRTRAGVPQRHRIDGADWRAAPSLLPHPSRSCRRDDRRTEPLAAALEPNDRRREIGRDRERFANRCLSPCLPGRSSFLTRR